MAVIDLRDDPRLEMQMAQNIGQGLGAAFGAYRRHEAEKALVGILSQGAADGKTPEEMHDLILASAKARRSLRGQEIAKLHFEEQTGTGRYDPAVLAKQKRENERADAMTNWYNKRTVSAGAGGTGNSINSLKTELDVIEKLIEGTDPGSEEEARLEARKKEILNTVAPMRQAQQSKTPGVPWGNMDSTAIGIPPQQPQVAGGPGIFSQSRQQPQVPPAGNMGPPVDESIRSRLHFENVPYRQPEADVRGLPQGAQSPQQPSIPKPGFGAGTQGVAFGGYNLQEFNQPPTPQQAKADAAIAKTIAPEMQLSPTTQAQPQSGQEPRITNDAEYDALQSGTVFIDPDGKRRTKP